MYNLIYVFVCVYVRAYVKVCVSELLVNFYFELQLLFIGEKITKGRRL
jgi:hypothetical protein